jgi:Bacterial protein of unknown function (DUF882)
LLVLAQIGATMIAVPPDSARRHNLASDSSDMAVGVVADTGAPIPEPDSLFGLSGKLRAHFLGTARHALDFPILRRFFGDTAADSPGVYALGDSVPGGRPFSLITMVPFTTKAKGRVGDYRVGWWPAERRRARSATYANPDGFIRVTPDNEDTQVSEHFRLRDFLTHDQEDIWPKYLVLREELVDKLELIIADLAEHGHPDANVVIMSGFRTPEYNAMGVGRRGGRARDSRHQFGDAADIYVNDGQGIMEDLNGDGRVDTRDVHVLLESVDRVEAEHPELVGGAGVYRGTKAHGPFLHVDTRGERVRWAFEDPPHRARRKSKKPAAPKAATGTATPTAAPAGGTPAPSTQP